MSAPKRAPRDLTEAQFAAALERGGFEITVRRYRGSTTFRFVGPDGALAWVHVEGPTRRSMLAALHEHREELAARYRKQLRRNARARVRAEAVRAREREQAEQAAALARELIEKGRREKEARDQIAREARTAALLTLSKAYPQLPKTGGWWPDEDDPTVMRYRLHEKQPEKTRPAPRRVVRVEEGT